MRIVDVVLAFPEVVFAILVAAVLGPGIGPSSSRSRWSGGRASRGCALARARPEEQNSSSMRRSSPARRRWQILLPPPAAEHRGAAARARLGRRRLHHHGGGDAELPRARRPGADAELGRHDPRRPAGRCAQIPMLALRRAARCSASRSSASTCSATGLRDVARSAPARTLTRWRQACSPSTSSTVVVRRRGRRARGAERRLLRHRARARSLGVVGESGSGKSVTALAIMRLLGEQGVIAGRRHPPRRASDLLALDDGDMRAMRGRRIAHDLPGADDEPQPAAHGRLPDRGGARARTSP